MTYILSKYFAGTRHGSPTAVITGKTIRWLLFVAAYHTAQNMIITTECGEPLIRCIVDGVMPQRLQKVLRGETL